MIHTNACLGALNVDMATSTPSIKDGFGHTRTHQQIIIGLAQKNQLAYQTFAVYAEELAATGDASATPLRKDAMFGIFCDGIVERWGPTIRLVMPLELRDIVCMAELMSNRVGNL